MYHAFELTAKFSNGKKELPHYYNEGKSQFDNDQKFINSKLEEFLLPNGNFDASSMKDTWFPQIQADIFLSHAHVDEEFALIIAGYLKKELGLKVFIDSCVWGDSNKLLQTIDNEICKNDDGKTYNYQKRNYTTTHIHIMLASALHEMIYNTEAVFFLNTHKSAKVNTKDLVKRTESGWIYSEIKMCNLVHRRLPNEHDARESFKKLKLFASGGLTESLKSFEWELDTSSFKQLTWSDIRLWRNNINIDTHPLDTLYEQCQIVK